MCPLGAPVPLGNGWDGPNPLGNEKGAAPDVVEKGPFGEEAPDPPASPSLTVEVTVTVS